jgi:hypothetical protein
MFDDLLLKRFDIRTYNCWDLTREVWLRLTGQDLGSPELIYYTREEFGDVVEAWQDTRFLQIEDNPAQACIVLMLRPRIMPHVGVYLGRRENRVIHIRRAGVQVQPPQIATMGFTSVKYYLPCQL